jgi:hypothetical protein
MRGLSGEKLGKLVRDLSLVAILLAELLGWLTNLRDLGARTVALRKDRVEAALCWDMVRSRGCDVVEEASVLSIATAH